MKRSILKVVLSTAVISSLGFSQSLTLSGHDIKFSKKLSLNKLKSYSIDEKDVSIIIKIKNSLTKNDKEKLYKSGAKVITYAGINSYYVLTPQENVDNIIENLEKIDGVALLKPEYKIDQNLKNINLSQEIEIELSLFQNITQDNLKKLLLENGIDFKSLKVDTNLKSAQLKVYGIDIQRIASLAIVKEINKIHKITTIKPFSINIGNRGIYTANPAGATNSWKNFTGLDGANIPVAIVDEGKVLKSHKEFTEGETTKIKDFIANSPVALHSTHIAGIIGAKGVKESAKGIAEGTQIYSFSYKDFNFAKSISYLSSKYGILVSNHSYGYASKSDLGRYNSDAAKEDSLVYNNPFINVFMAAGNDRAYDDYPDVGIIKGGANAKNIFTIGALDNSSNYPAYYTSTGPVKDFRIKPDLAVRGSSVYSTSSSGGYAYQTGTSMASPAAMALATLVMQEYKDLTDCGNGIGCDMRHDLLKAVLINSAIDKSLKGPDIYTGYGLINVQKAVEEVKSIENNLKMIKLDKIGRGSVKEYNFTHNGGKFSITLSWVDPAGNSANDGKSLVNDLDIYILDKNGKKYYPYSLNKDDVKAPALQDRKNDVDNTEKIEVDNLPSGDYKIVVSGENIQTSTQEFALASNKSIFSSFSNIISLKTKIEVNNFARVILESIY